jgi:hypothetical protein
MTTCVFMKLLTLAVCLTVLLKLALKRRWESLGMAMLACVFLLGFAPYMLRKELRYRDQGMSTTAQVIGKERYYSGGRHGSGWHDVLKYRYQDSAGETFEGQADVPLSVWKQSEEGHDLAIVYLRDQPSESRLLVDYWPIGHCLGVVCFTCFWGGLGLCCAYQAIMAYPR